MSVDLIRSEIKISRSQTSNSTLLIAQRAVLGRLFPGRMVPGEQRPNPSLSCLRFAPSIEQILLSRNGLSKVPRTVFGFASPVLS